VATIPELYEQVLSGAVEYALLPLENSMEGGVGATLDLLFRTPGPKMVRELVISVRHHLLAPPHTAADKIQRVLSHPQALAQCSRFLHKHLPDATLEPTASTADAARRAASNRGCAAIASRVAAQRYGLSIVVEDIHDSPDNSTRFVLLGAHDEGHPTGSDRTSLALTLERDQPGGLHGILEEFASRGINLSRIESRPLGGPLGHYVFFIDLEAHREDQATQEALAALERRASELRVFGSYPQAPGPGS
jgi:prephenate dehydratase